MATPKISATKNYGLFVREDSDNRKLKTHRVRKLEASMRKYGFLNSFPVSCLKDKRGRLVVKDGQHRLYVAELLGLAVKYIVESVAFNTAEVSIAVIPWNARDYALRHAANGLADYQEGLEFSERHGIPLGLTFALLAGTTSFGNVSGFRGGTFQVKDQEWAEAVASVYGRLTGVSPCLRSARMVQACMAICRVPEFDEDRLIQGAERCRDKLVKYSTKDAYLSLLEEVYNFGRKQLFGLKIAATLAMRDRNFHKNDQEITKG